MPAKLMHPRYDELGSLGEGGVARTVLVWDSVARVRRAAKISLNPDSAEAFLSEYHLLSSLNHPGLPRVYDLHHLSDGNLLFTMDYAGPVSLHSLLKNKILWSKEDFISVLDQLLSVLAHCHTNNVVHHDLNPANIVFQSESPSSSLKLIDFGFASALGSSSPQVRGTVQYTAPEILRKESSDHRSDLYAFGVILYEILAGVNPFDDDNVVNVVINHLEKPVSGVPGAYPWLDKNLVDLIVKCLQKDPKLRYQSTSEMEDDLDRAGILRRKTIHLRNSFLHREEKLDHLKQSMKDVLNFKTPAVFIGLEGDLGLGKTTLLKKLKQHAELEGHRLVYLPITHSGAFENSTRFMRSLLTVHTAPIPDRFHRELEWLKDPESGAFSTTQLLFSSLIDLAMICMEGQPLMFFFDDVDHLTEMEASFFAQWHRRLQSQSGVFLCCAFSDAAKLPWEPEEEIRLTPFGEEETADYLRKSLRVESLPEGLTSNLFSWTRGNPFLLKNTLGMLTENGALVYRHEEYFFDEKQSPPIPSGIRDFVLFKLENLSEDERVAMDLASIFPAEFEWEAFRHLSDSPPLNAFRRLVEKGLVHPIGGRWIVSDEFLRNHVSGRMPPSRLLELHRAAALYYESLSEKNDAALAHHWYCSDQPEKAVPYLLRDAITDRRNWQLSSALEKYNRVLPLLKKSNPEAYVEQLLEAEEVCDQLGLREEQVRLLNDLSELAGDTLQVRYLTRKANLDERLGNLEEARQSLLKAIEIGTSRDDKGLGDVYRLLGRVCYLQKNMDQAKQYYEKALQAAVQEKDGELQIKTRNSLATIFGSLKDLDSARMQFDEIESVAEALGLIEYQAQAVINSAQTLNRQQRFEDALERLRSVEGLLKKTHHRKLELSHARFTGLALLRQNRFEAAENAFAKAYDIAFEIDDSEAIHSMLYRKGIIYGRLGLLKPAEQHLTEALEKAMLSEHREDVILYNTTLAQIKIAQNRLDDAEQLISRAQDSLTNSTPNELCCFVKMAWLEVLTHSRFRTMSFEEYESSVSTMASLLKKTSAESNSLQILALVTWAKALRAIGRIGEALKAVDRAGDLLEQTPYYEYDPIELWYLKYELSSGAQRSRKEIGRSLEKAYQEIKQVEAGLKRSDFRTAFISTALHRRVIDDYKHYFDEERESDIRSFQTLYSIVEDINSILNADELFDAIMDSAIEHTGADRGMILLHSDSGDAFEIKVARNMDQETLTDMTHISQSIVREVFDAGQSLVTADANQDDRFKARKSIVAFQIRSVMCVPLRIRDRKLGAVYVDKQFDTHHFTDRHLRFLESFSNMAGVAIENARLYEKVRQEKESLSRENEDLKTEVLEKYQKYNIVGKSKLIRNVFRLIENSADHEATVLIQGESGTGKELVAKAIHYNGIRRHKKFIAVDCGALPENLLESELFGYKKGAFTGAGSDKKGLFEEADGGTLFLDEISNTSTVLQAKLLRVLQEGEIRRVGETSTRKIDVRVIAATNRNLLEDVKAGVFREDLYYRINVVPIVLPPLRERREDIPLLIAFFLDKYAAIHHKERPQISQELADLMSQMPWEGNIRELENVVNRMMIFHSGKRLGLDQLPEPWNRKPAGLTTTQALASSTPTAGFESVEAMEQFVNRIEKEFFEQVLANTGGNKSEAAKKLGIKRTTLNDRLKKHDLL